MILTTICSHCKKVRIDGTFYDTEAFMVDELRKHKVFSDTVCDPCFDLLYGEIIPRETIAVYQ
jgi:hypothetical protein